MGEDVGSVVCKFAYIFGGFAYDFINLSCLVYKKIFMVCVGHHELYDHIWQFEFSMYGGC